MTSSWDIWRKAEKNPKRCSRVVLTVMDMDCHQPSREKIIPLIYTVMLLSHTHTHTHTHTLSLSLSPKASIYPIMLANWASLDINEKSISDLSLRSFFKDMFPVADGEKSACNAGDPSSIPGEGRSSGEGNGKPTPVFLPGESPGQRSLAGYSPWGCKELDMTEWLNTFTLEITQFKPCNLQMTKLRLKKPITSQMM